MSKVSCFEDLVAWQLARVLVRDVYAATDKRPLSTDFALHHQLRKSALSVCSNIAEGFERWSRAEFRHFLRIARASCGEVRSQLYNALDVGFLARDEFEALMQQCQITGRTINKLRCSLGRTTAAPGTRHQAPVRNRKPILA